MIAHVSLKCVIVKGRVTTNPALSNHWEMWSFVPAKAAIGFVMDLQITEFCLDRGICITERPINKRERGQIGYQMSRDQ